MRIAYGLLTSRVISVSTNMHTELIVIHLGLMTLVDLGLGNVELKLDSLKIVNFINIGDIYFHS